MTRDHEASSEDTHPENEKKPPTALLHRDCPLCGRDNRDTERDRYSVDTWDLKRCADCGFVYIENPPDYERLVAEYDWSKTRPARKKKRYGGSRVLRGLSSLLKAPKLGLRRGRHAKVASYVNACASEGRLLDVGCAQGLGLTGVHETFIPYGIEISPVLAAEATDVFHERGGHVECAPALHGLDRFDADFFDVIVMRSYLEHEVRPREVLAGAARILAPTGHIVIKVPNFACVFLPLTGKSWCGFRFPDHVNYFTPGSLQRMLSATGLEVARSSLWYRWGLSDSLWMVAKKRPADQT